MEELKNQIDNIKKQKDQLDREYKELCKRYDHLQLLDVRDKSSKKIIGILKKACEDGKVDTTPFDIEINRYIHVEIYEGNDCKDVYIDTYDEDNLDFIQKVFYDKYYGTCLFELIIAYLNSDEVMNTLNDIFKKAHIEWIWTGEFKSCVLDLISKYSCK